MAGILVVDDDPQLRKLVGLCLGQRGYEVAVVASGKLALEFVREHRNTLNLVLSDVEMPGMDGLELRERLLPTGLPVVLMSGWDRVLEPGLLRKPFTVEELWAAIGEALLVPERAVTAEQSL